VDRAPNGIGIIRQVRVWIPPEPPVAKRLWLASAESRARGVVARRSEPWTPRTVCRSGMAPMGGLAGSTAILLVCSEIEISLRPDM
jgi:hypothetical protein